MPGMYELTDKEHSIFGLIALLKLHLQSQRSVTEAGLRFSGPLILWTVN